MACNRKPIMFYRNADVSVTDSALNLNQQAAFAIANSEDCEV